MLTLAPQRAGFRSGLPMKHIRRITNRISELRPLAAWATEIARELGCPADRCFDVDLCLTEAVSNIIRHGYADDALHEIVVELTREPDGLAIDIEDDARPFDPLSAPVSVARSLAEARPNGRGIVLLRGAADSARYECRDGRNCLTLTIAIPK